jgi:hypothetical protein
MKNFLEVAEDLAGEGRLSDDDTRRIRSVFDFRARVETAESKAGLDLTNLEDLFGLVDVQVRVNPDDADARALRTDFVFLILRTLESRIKEPVVPITVRTRQAADNVLDMYVSVSDHFVDMVARRWMPRGDLDIAKDSIITLNYDLLFDRALYRRGLVADYCLPAMPAQKTDDLRVRLLKLHGSGGWGWCNACQFVSVVGEAPTEKHQPLPCVKCENPTEILIVPPTWSKGDYPKALDRVWKAAFEELKSANRLVLIGMSLPESDRFLRFLLGLALARNSALDRILIVNPEAGTRLYGTLFEQLPKRVRVDPLVMTFEGAVAGGQLQRMLGQTFPQKARAW